jgi:hypothetical protein
MSTIKSSTTLTTAYSVEADTTGALVIQTGATPTTAVTVSSAQVVTLANALPVASGGTGATSNAAAPFALKGANSDITSLTGLTTALSLAQGGTAATSASAARTSLGLVIGTDVLAPSGSGASLTSLNATNISSGTLAKARLPTGTVLQVVNTMNGAVATGTTTIPQDNTIPQITEGTEFMTLAITPTSTTSKLRIDVVVNGAGSASNSWATALFQDSTANALAATNYNMGANNVVSYSGFTHFMTAGTTSSTTFRVRCGTVGAGTFTFNGQSAGRIFGGVIASSITITEIAA